jgi:hypothetical protein
MCLLPACVEDLPREFAFFRKNFPAVKEKGRGGRRDGLAGGYASPTSVIEVIRESAA